MSKHRTHRTIWNRLLSGVLCLALVLGLLPATGLIQPAEAAGWADPYGEQLVEWGVMNPSSDLRLGDEITRAEFVAMCNRAFGYKKLGGTPFIDVPSYEWYAEDIDIAYNAGYFKGTTSDPAYPKASPNSTLTREQAAVLLARNLMLQETVGESLGFTDSRELSEWSRGLIATAVAGGVITGYSDGSFRPASSITRGEVAALLVRAIGTLVSGEGSHELGSVYGNVVINSSHVTLRNTTIVGDLYITGGVDLGKVLLENVTVLGKIIVSGGGESDAAQSSVVLRNVVADELVVDSIIDQFVTVSAYGLTDIPVTNVRSDAYLEDACMAGYGLHHIELVAGNGAKLQLAGTIKEVVNKTPFSDLQLVKGTAERITIDEYAKGSTLLVDIDTLVKELNLDVATLVTGKGDIKDLNIGAEGCVVEILPENVTIRPGITATVNGVLIGSVDASELSSEPRLLAGYPGVTNITPTQAEGLFAGNKPGTIYWAVSELADGSVSPEDLLKNPVYGGNIFENQAGSISASSKSEYGRLISNLVPGGSYYISAILVDGRDVRSPLKVISFTTPDNTLPAFVGDPYMSKETCETAQVTATANKNCLLYWALLTEGAEAPTPQEFKTGSIGGNYGYGSVNVVKNVPVSINVNRSRLREKTTYWLYLWLTDENGAQSMAEPIRLTVTTPDETPPIVSVPVQTAYGESTAGITFSINEVPSTLYWAVVAEGDETFIAPGDTAEETAQIMSDMRTKIKVENGAGAIVSGNTAAAGANLDTLFTITGLNTANTKTNNYIMYYVARDAAGNYSDRVGYIRIRTLDTVPPTVEIEFTDAVDGKPRATSDVKLVFSEQVKGSSKQSTETSGNAPVTFLDFYNQVVAYKGTSMESTAKNNLAKELAAHIKMYSVPRTGQPVPLTPLHELEQVVGADTTNWVIDWREAVVTLESDGSVVITLPADKALQMDSGATYYFQLLGVYDNAYIPNGVMGDRNGNYKLDNFTTVYAQVEIRQNTSITNIESGNDLDGIRLDMCFDVIPESTQKVPLTEYWDLLMWSNTVMRVEVYRKMLDAEGKDIPGQDWEQVSGEIRFESPNAGTGLDARKTDAQKEGGLQYETVQEGLEEERIYRYGIHITQIGSVPESRGLDETLTPQQIKKQEPVSWGDSITMSFELVAGARGDIVNLSSSVATYYNKYINVDKTVSEIGTVYTSTGTVNTLTYEKQFVDTRVPSFRSTYPQFTPGSGAITMEVSLDRAGTVYYVVGKAGANPAIPTSIDGTTLINETNDGGDKTTAAPSASSKTYIPTDGSDRDKAENKSRIHYMTGGNDGGPGEYNTPIYSDIRNGDTVYGNNPDIKKGSIEVGSSNETVLIDGLLPETEYYVYIVLQGGGDPGYVVQVYRVYTTEVTPPAIDITGTGNTGVTIAVNNVNTGSGAATKYNNSDLYYALVELNRLPTMYNDLYNWVEGGTKYTGSASNAPDTVMSVLDAMITMYPGGGGKTYFDMFGGDFNLKDTVMRYISGTTTDNPTTTPTHRYLNISENPKNEDFSTYMSSDVSEYIVLACAMNAFSAKDSGSSYGFAAARGIYTPDEEPPEFINTNYDSGYYAASMDTSRVVDSSGRPVGWQQWVNSPTQYAYNGSVSISFNKEIYLSINNIRYEIVFGEATGNRQISLSEVLGGTAVTSGRAVVTQTSGTVSRGINLTLNGIMYNDTIIFSTMGKICNGSNYASDYMLVLTFDPTLTTANFNRNTALETPAPGFRVSWVKVS